MAQPAHRKRRRSWDFPGHAHCLTFSCLDRRPFLRRERACLWLVDAIRQAKTKAPFDLWGYIFMPEHVHVIVHPADSVPVSSILYQIKKPVTTWAIAWLHRHRPSGLVTLEDPRPSGKVFHRFWLPGGGYDRSLRSVEDVYEKIEYIHANPVRRGLVTHPSQWQWSSWRCWHEHADEPLPVDRDTLPPRLL